MNFIELCKSIMICIFILTTSQFGFLNVVGVRKELFAFFVLAVPLWFVIEHSRNNGFKLNTKTIIIWSTLNGLFIIYYLLHKSINWSLYHVLVVLIIIYICNQTFHFIELLTKSVIIMFSLFAFFVFIQFIVYLHDPGVFFRTSHDYTSNSLFDDVSVPVTIGYLGQYILGARNIIFNVIEIPRFLSFSPEPSALVGIFLAPCLLALTYRGIYIYLSLMLLFCFVFITSTSTGFLSIALGCQFFIIFFVIDRVKIYKKIVIFVILLLTLSEAYYFLRAAENFRSLFGYALKIESFSTIAVSQESSYFLRTQGIVGAMLEIIANPLGFEERPASRTATGAIISIGLQLGVFGLITMGYIYYRTLKELYNVFISRPGMRVRIAMAGLFGMLVQSMIFSGYEWTTGGGFITLLLIYLRSKHLMLMKQNRSIVLDRLK